GINYTTKGNKVTSVAIRNVPSYVAATGVRIDVPGLGPLSVDVAYGGNFYAIIEPQGPYEGIDQLGAARILSLSPVVPALMRKAVDPVHPLDSTIRGVSHVMWTDKPKGEGADGRNAVFYGDRAIDRSPCGTGTSARLAHLAARGQLKVGDHFVHESIICSRFIGRVLQTVDLRGTQAIIPMIEGSAFATGFNTLWIDLSQPVHSAFQVV